MKPFLTLLYQNQIMDWKQFLQDWQEFLGPKRFQWYALKLVVICTAVFGLTFLFPGLKHQFALKSASLLSEPWTVFTHIFLHGDLKHLFYNMFALGAFGSILEKEIGSKRFLIIFFAGALVSSVADVLFYPSTIGASGAIFALLGCLAILKPKTVVWALGVPMYIAVAIVIWILIDLTGFFYPDNVAHAAHLFGAGFGMLWGLFLRTLREEPKNKQKKQKEPLTDKEVEEWEEEYMMEG